MTDAERLAILEDAMRKLQALMQQVVRPTPAISSKLFEIEVIGIVDSPEVNKAMGVKVPEDDFEVLEGIFGKPLTVEFPDDDR